MITVGKSRFSGVIFLEMSSFQHTNIHGGRALIIDIGVHTNDWLVVNPGGKIDYSLARSAPQKV
jgi:hypothetical protein